MSAHPHPTHTPNPEDDTFYQVDLASLAVGSYNRALSGTHVDAIVHAYKERPWAMPAIECNMRENGQLVVVNGQHRAEAARRMGWPSLKAVVHFGWTEDEEAQAFRDSARGKRVDALSLWHAARLAGEADVLGIELVLDLFGLHVPRRTNQNFEPGAITCPDALLAVAYNSVQGGRTPKNVFRPERVEQVLRFVIATWPDDPRRFDSRVLRMLAGWFMKYQDHPSFNLKEAQRKLSVYDCRELIRRSQTLIHTEGLNGVQAGIRVLTGMYDKSRRVARLVPLENEGEQE